MNQRRCKLRCLCHDVRLLMQAVLKSPASSSSVRHTVMSAGACKENGDQTLRSSISHRSYMPLAARYCPFGTMIAARMI
ncbi:hypothetical protein BaRGS_00034834 [Batillaria attramentaria]|uniref:Secreted protein n=1 Tax=Batillaria attramentaria TaxID=370345 RepID=A0ABD0JG88_9CAEN